MATVVTWTEVERRLTELVGELQMGTLLRLRAVGRPVDWAVQIRQAVDTLSAVAVVDSREGDRVLAPEADVAMAEFGWQPPDPEHPGTWWLALDWPPFAADYRRLAAAVVGALRDGYGLGRPADWAYELLRRNGDRLSADLGLAECEVRYFVRLAAGDRPDRPSGLLRRTQVGPIYHDEALGRDGRWRFTETLELSELGELSDRVQRVSEPAANEVVDWWRLLVREEERRQAEQRTAEEARARRDPSLPRVARSVDEERDEAGRPVIRTPRLHDRERAAVVAYLRDAPLVAVAYGFDVDPFDLRRPEVVPLHFHTDGEWVWSESLAYFAERYGISPEPDLMAHLARRQYRLPDVDDERIAKAAEVLRG